MADTISRTNKRKYVRYPEACELYGVSLSTMKRWVKASGSGRKVDKLVLINTEVLDQYIETFLLFG